MQQQVNLTVKYFVGHDGTEVTAKNYHLPQIAVLTSRLGAAYMRDLSEAVTRHIAGAPTVGRNRHRECQEAESSQRSGTPSG
ncbi:hypothetical protein J6590_044555 [Homalodisca vitripennis]|nr:hypothetical protein J6590_044555 [Homalodisca vitripennis]